MNLVEIIESLRDLVRESPKARIFLTERALLQELFRDISPKKDGIKNYLEMRLERDEEPEAMMICGQIL